MPRTIVWLASYPKSGNTWVRLFLFNYLFNLDKPAPINQAHRIGPSDVSAGLYRKAASAPFDPHNQTQVLSLRNRVIAAHASGGADVNFMKTHNANISVLGQPLIPNDMTRSAIYIIRDPLDMAVSYANHFNLSHAQTVHTIGHADAATMADESVVHQYLGAWSNHVRSWAHNKKLKCHVMRYEDMSADPISAFASMLGFIGAPVDQKRVQRAVQYSRFDEARKQESEHGFVEKSGGAERFFRSGKVGEGRQTLAPDLIDRIIADHGDVMKKYGYL